jgi:8-oxo-dGTP diphosphatase
MAEDQFWIGVHGVIAKSGRLLVLRRAPVMSYKPGSWDLPGGHLALGEPFEACLRREVAEETGLTVAVERLIGLNTTEGPYVQALYACRAVGPPDGIRLQPREHVDARWVTVGELGGLELIPYLEGILKRGMLGYLSA